jgi:hypothetical protein
MMRRRSSEQPGGIDRNPSTGNLSNSPTREIVFCESSPKDVLIDKLIAELSVRIILNEYLLIG